MTTYTTNVPAPTFGDTGFTAPSDSEILAGVQADQQSAFGSNLGTSLDTPQGQLATSLTAIIAYCYDQFIALANGVDPSYASGRMQDGIGRIYFLSRNAATATSVTATCAGASGTIIPIGAKAQDQAGNVYLCTEAGTIPSSGSINLTFQCATLGAIACPSGYLNAIYQSITGWDSITNASAGSEGSDVETRDAFEARRSASVSANAQGNLDAIQAAVLSLSGVTDCYCLENDTSSAVTTNGVTLAANSIYVAVVGGTSSAIAAAIWAKKSPGCAYTGNTTVTVTDTSSYYSAPYPTYSVTYEVPTSTAVLFAVSMQNNSSVPSNATTLIQNVIISAFLGEDGGARAKIGSYIFASRFYAGIAALGSWALIYSVQIGTSTANASYVQMQANQAPTLQASNISVTFS